MELQLKNTPNKIGKTNTIDMYIYSKNTSIHKHTTQRIQSIQRCFIQHGYTKRFNTQYVPKEKGTHQELQKNI